MRMSPFCLKPGDQVALVCTGTPCDSELDAELSADYLQNHLGVRVKYRHDTYQALPAQLRAQMLFEYLADPQLTAIWSVRGGEGTADLIPFLAARAKAIQSFSPKLLIGFSDFTPLLVYFRQQFNWPTLHGVGSRQLPKKMIDTDTEKATLGWLSDASRELRVTKLQPLNVAAYTQQTLEAEVLGGNLTLLGISVADTWQPNLAGRIVLLEEVNEEPYKVARTLKYLSRINFFQGAVAIILGGFDFPAKSSLENEQKFALMLPILRQFAEGSSCPVFFTREIGHGLSNLPIPFYVKAKLQAGAHPQLIFNR